MRPAKAVCCKSERRKTMANEIYIGDYFLTEPDPKDDIEEENETEDECYG
jgi:hypothetical protein